MVFKTMGLNEISWGDKYEVTEYPTTEVTEKWPESWKTKDAVSSIQEKCVSIREGAVNCTTWGVKGERKASDDFGNM